MTVLTAHIAMTSTRSERENGTAPSEMSELPARKAVRETGKLCPPGHMVRPPVPSHYQDCEVQVNLFKIVKTTVTVRRAAALYGLPITTTGMTRCPFHEDHTPSMKLNDTYYYCFGCGATGDVIDLTARIFDLSSLQAARKLAQDFGLGPDKPPSDAIVLPKPSTFPSDAQQEDIAYCLRVLHNYRDLLTRWRTEHAPHSPEESLDERFVEALHLLDVVDDLMDCLTFGPAAKKADAAKRLLAGQLLPQMATRLDTLKAKEAA